MPINKNLYRTLNLAGAIFVVALSLCGTTANALELHDNLAQCRLDVWSVRDGLPPQPINAIAQTPDGFLWLASGAGLLRFDGSTFYTFDAKNTHGSKMSDLVTLTVSKSGELWAGGSWTGFGKFEAGTFTRVQPAVPGWHVINTIHQAPDGSIWAGGFGSNDIYRASNGKVQTVPGYNDSVVNILDGDNGSLLALTYNQGLISISPSGKPTTLPIDKRLPLDFYTSMCRTADGDIWIGTVRSGLIRITGTRIRTYQVKDGLPANEVHCVYVSPHNQLWIGTSNGLSSWDGTHFSSFGKIEGLPDSEVHTIYEDREGNLWVGAGSELCRFAETKLKPYSAYIGAQCVGPASYSALAVDPMSTGPHTALFCVTLRGLVRVDDKGVAWVGGPFHRRFDCMAIGPDNLVWLWSHPVNGEDVYTVPLSDIRKWTLPVGQVPPDSPSASLKQYPHAYDQHQFNVAFAIRGSLTAFDDHGEIRIKPGKIIDRKPCALGWVFSGAKDPTGTIWINSTGFWKVTDKGIEQVSTNSNTHHLGIDVSDVHNIWCATDHGLERWIDGKAHIYHMSDGLPTDEFFQVIDDRNGSIWLGYKAGICSIRKSDVDAYDRHEIRSLPVNLFGAEDGIRDFPSYFTSLRTPDGRVWMSAPKSLTVIDPLHMTHNAIKPPVSILDAEVDGTKVQGEHNRIRPGPGNLRVHFAALTFVAPERVKFAYRLVGVDSAWTYTTDHVAAFGNLPPGTYRFQVIACNNDGVWNRLGASVVFSIAPHYYQTWWFRSGAVAIGLIVIVFVIRQRTHQLRKRNVELEARIAERTSELLDSNTELEAAKSELEAAFGELSETNQQLEEIQAELEAQNAELIETRETLAAANERLESLATTDGLTGLKNHRAFQEQLTIEWQQYQRSLHPLSVILMDVDKFKSYNDTYGHPGGDEVLRRVAKLVAENARESDFAARYGGEEFVIVLPNTGGEGAVQLAERVRAAIEQAEWPNRPVTASFGVATVDVTIDSAATLVANADAALYRSKEGGRNRVTPFRVVEPSVR